MTTIRITPITGDSAWQLFNMAKATRAGEALEYEQFINKLRDGDGEPDNETLGSDGEFYVDTDAAILYFKIGGTWTSIGGGSGGGGGGTCLLYTSPSPRDRQKSRMPSSA